MTVSGGSWGTAGRGEEGCLIFPQVCGGSGDAYTGR